MISLGKKKSDVLLLVFFSIFSIAIFVRNFTDNFSLSYQRVLKFFFVILFIFSFNFIIKNHHKELRNIFGAWCIIFLLVILDLFIEFILGKNLLGQSTMMSGRLGSFTGEEAVIGGFF